MKRKLAWGLMALLLLRTLLLPAWAEQQDVQILDENDKPWLFFSLPEGVDCLPSPLEREPSVPQGLEGLYQWMQPRDRDRDTWFFRMPYGRVLASASRTELGEAIPAPELLAFWPRIAAVMGQSTAFVDDKPENASLQTLGGREWLSIQTKAALDGAKMLSVTVKGLANCDEGALVEVWIVSPALATYRYDDAAYAELKEDQETAKRWLESLSLSQP